MNGDRNTDFPGMPHLPGRRGETISVAPGMTAAEGSPDRQQAIDAVATALVDGLEYFGHELDDVTGLVHAITPQAKKYEDALAALAVLVEPCQECEFGCGPGLGGGYKLIPACPVHGWIVPLLDALREKLAEAEREIQVVVSALPGLPNGRTPGEYAADITARLAEAERERDEALAANEAAKQFSYASHRRRAEQAERQLEQARAERDRLRLAINVFLGSAHGEVARRALAAAEHPEQTEGGEEG